MILTGNGRITFRDGVAIIPEGYRWCAECELLTPHQEIKEEKSYQISQVCCKICGTAQPYDGCDNCGAEIPELEGSVEEIVMHSSLCHFDRYYEEGHEDKNSGGSFSVGYPGPLADFIVRSFEQNWMRQSPGYWKQNWKFPEDTVVHDVHLRFRHRIDEERARTCDCPRVTVYSAGDLAMPSYESHGYASMDCMDAKSWQWSSRCPICGYVNERDDDSC